MRGALIAAGLAALAGCATRPVNPPLAQVQPQAGYRYETRVGPARDGDTLLVLAFSGGGTRAAAFSYGVLEALRDIELPGPDGRSTRLLDQVGVVAGVSGGSFTALAFGLHGDRLFEQYEQRFLKRNVQGELLHRLFDPGNWGALWSTGWGRSELAADYYDEILFDGATYGDLMRRPGPMIIASATDVSSGARFYYTQVMFDILCSDLSAIRLSRAAASSSAVPVVLSPVTINNYGGSCGYREPPWVQPVAAIQDRERPAARVMQEVGDLRAYEDGRARPYIHLVDGGVSDNLAMRAVLEVLDQLEAMRYLGLPTPMDRIERVALVIVNSLSKPQTGWDQLIGAPGPIDVLLQATGVPIDHYSFEAIGQARDTAARWRTYRAIRDSGAIADSKDPALRAIERVPDAELFVIDVSFAGLQDAAEREYLNALPTSFVLGAEAVDRLRRAAGQVLVDSPEFQRLLRDLGHAGAARSAP